MISFLVPHYPAHGFACVHAAGVAGTIKDSDFVVETTYSIRANANTVPWQIDFTTKTKTGQVVDIKAICELRGDTLKINIGSKGAGRPSSFEQKQDCTLLNYKRMKIKSSE